jgi:hypothetical protein
MAFILALTWFLMRCVKSVSTTVVNLNPYDVADNLKARRILTQTRCSRAVPISSSPCWAWPSCC